MRLSIKIAALCALAISMGTVLRAEPLEFIFEHYSSDEGLPHNSICDIHQDSRGYMWLCTWYGLSRFDGNEFVNFTMLPGDYSNLSHNRILSVDEDANGYLWLLTYDYHLYRFDVEEEVFVSIPSDLPDLPVTDLKADFLHCDTNGNTWVSLTDAGLLKVDSELNPVHWLTVSDTAPGQEIRHIFEDDRGNIYVVSEVGISLIEKDNQATLLARNSDVVAFAQLDGSLFFACPDHVLVIDRESRGQKKIDLKKLDSGRATTMTVTGDDEKVLYVGLSDNAVAHIDHISMQASLLRNDMGRVRYLFPDPEGLLWIATERTGIWSYNDSLNRFRHYEHSRNVMSYYVDTLARVENRDGRLWIKMNNWGFGYYDRCCDRIVPLSNVKEEPDCRFMNGVACYDIDSTGVLWMSTVGRGLDKVTVISPKTDRIVPPTRFSDNMASAEIRAMMRDSKGYIWAAAKSRELYRYSPDMETCTRFSNAEVGDVGVIYSIFEDNAGNVWLGTKGDGLIRLTDTGNGWERKHFRSEKGNPSSLSSNNIYCIEQDNDGRIWVGTYGGALSMLPDPDSDEFVTVESNFPRYPQTAGERVRYLHCMPDGRMLVASVGGLIWFHPSDTPELTEFHLVRKIPGDIHSLGNNDVMHIFTDAQSRTWLCTFGGGLNRLYFEDGVPRFDVISTDGGLSSNIILSGIDDSEGKIWIATESGLSTYDPSNGDVTNFTRYDGVASTSYSEATCASLIDGRLVFGTLDNLQLIDPRHFDAVDKDSRMAITGLVIDGNRVSYASGIEIPDDYSFFRIDFASLDFSSNRRTDYVYMLEGYDKDWISSSSSNSAVYSRIPPGRYIFKAASGTHTEVSDIAMIPVRVRPTMWNSALAIIIYVLLGLSILALLVRLFLSQMKLQSDVRLEQDLSDIKARFFTNISHELRTPLTLILGGIEEIGRKTQPGDLSEYSVNIVRRNAKRMMTLINQLLDIRTIVNGKMRLKVSHFDVLKLVQGVYDDFRDMSVERQMEMRIVKSVDSLMVWGDRMRLEALVYNLLSNAFKYTSDGGKIEVGLLYREGDPDFRIMVKDNGIGVPKNKQESIFEPFTKGADAFKGMASSGIGLSFCKEIADIHGGKIWVESHAEGGSKFFVRLPISRDRFAEEDVQLVEGPVGDTASESYGLSKYKVAPTYPDGALKVLVVEDNAELKVYIYNCLVNKYEVRDASNGREALNVMTDWTPDIIVTDLMMPEMDGIELTNHVRNDFNTSHIPIVMITAKHEDDTHLKAMKYGADGYIAKPFSMELLIARIDNLLERRKALISTLSAGKVNEGTARTGKIEFTPEEIVITDRDEELIQKVMRWLEDNVSDAEVTVDQLATYVGMGRTSMYNKIKGLTGKSPVELIQEFRMEKATYYLKSGQYSVSETSYKVGFSDPGYFSRSFKKHFGISPAEYIKQHKNTPEDKEN